MGVAEFRMVVEDGLIGLPQDLKTVLRLLDDADLEDQERGLVAASLLHFLAGSNTIPGATGLLRFVDDALLLRFVLERLLKESPEVMAKHVEAFPEVFEPLAENLADTRAALGNAIVVFDRTMEKLPQQQFRGHSVAECIRDEEGSTWLYDAVHAALVDQLDYDEEEVVRAAKGVERMCKNLRQRFP